jgi:hypothetical protein
MFSVTYEIITEESAENGEAEDGGFIARDCDLRWAIALVNATDSCHCSQSAIEPSDSVMPRWFTVYNSADYITGVTENRSLHIPEHVTASSRRRIGRLLGSS